jgi:hypothetical protein
VALAAGAQGPFVTLGVTGPDREHVLTSINTLINYTAQELEAVQTQAGVKPVDMIKSIVIVPPGPPTAQTKTKTQDVLGVGIGGLVLTFLATFVVESVLASRRRKRRRVPFGTTAEDYDEQDSDADAGAGRESGAEGDEAELPQSPVRGYGNGHRTQSGPATGAGVPASPAAGASSRWYGMDAADPGRDAFQPARPELTVRTPSPSTRD